MKRAILLLLLAAVATIGGHVRASVSDGLSFDERISAAQLIFLGTVATVEYAQSEPAGTAQRRLPHTFVTFDIEQVVKGECSDGSITLRFLGGMAPDGRILTLSNAPLFDVGERSVLFVAGNEVLMSPLVGGLQGRFRVIDERVYDDLGREVQFDASGSLIAGAAHQLEEIRRHRFDLQGSELIRTKVGWRPSVEVSSNRAEQVLASQDALVVEEFLTTIETRIEATGDAARLGIKIISADPGLPFSGPVLRRKPVGQGTGGQS